MLKIKDVKDKKKFSIGMIGNFGGHEESANGQIIKTNVLYNGLKQYGKSSVQKLNTFSWNRHPLKLLFDFLRVIRKNNTLLMIVAHNGVGVFARLLCYAKLFRGNSIYYSVVGGWLPSMLKKGSMLKYLQKFDGIFVETSTMKTVLNKQGLNNIVVIPNFKEFKENICVDDSLIRLDIKKRRFCTFSRISREKGIPEAIRAIVKLYNKGFNVELDIYGSIVDDYYDEFTHNVDTYSDVIKYHGMISPNKSVDTIKGYYALIFPTKSYTEGIPGTIIDAYFAGIPVIVSGWESCNDIVTQETGIIYNFDDYMGLVEAISFAYNNVEQMTRMKKNCIIASKKYSLKSNIEKVEEVIYENYANNS